MVQSDQSLGRDEIIIRSNNNVSSQYWHLGEQFSKMSLEVDTICRENEYCMRMADPQRLDIQSCPHVVEQCSMSSSVAFPFERVLGDIV